MPEIKLVAGKPGEPQDVTVLFWLETAHDGVELYACRTCRPAAKQCILTITMDGLKRHLLADDFGLHICSSGLINVAR